MKSFPRKLLLLMASCAMISLPVFGDTINSNAKPSTDNKEESTSYFFASLLPKAFQTRPLVAISVITEMSDEGKKVLPPTLERPAYYSINSTGYLHKGHGPSDKHDVSEEILQNFIKTALANNHYISADHEHPASLVLFYVWGVHSKLDAFGNETDGVRNVDIRHKNLLSRAQLVGGVKFAREFALALNQRETKPAWLADARA